MNLDRAPPSILPHACDKLWDSKTKGGLFSNEVVSLNRRLFHLRGTFGFCFLEVQKCFSKRQCKILTHILLDGVMHFSIAVLLWPKLFERYHQFNKIWCSFCFNFFSHKLPFRSSFWKTLDVFFFIDTSTVSFSSNHQQSVVC